MLCICVLFESIIVMENLYIFLVNIKGVIYEKNNFNVKNLFNVILNMFVYLVIIVLVLFMKFEYWGIL